MTTKFDKPLRVRSIPMLICIWHQYEVYQLIAARASHLLSCSNMVKIRQSSSKYIENFWFWREIPLFPLNQCWISTRDESLAFGSSIYHITNLLHEKLHWYQHWLRGRGGFNTHMSFFYNILTMIVLIHWIALVSNTFPKFWSRTHGPSFFCVFSWEILPLAVLFRQFQS